jgi:hypothetical protein
LQNAWRNRTYQKFIDLLMRTAAFLGFVSSENKNGAD